MKLVDKTSTMCPLCGLWDNERSTDAVYQIFFTGDLGEGKIWRKKTGGETKKKKKKILDSLRKLLKGAPSRLLSIIDDCLPLK